MPKRKLTPAERSSTIGMFESGVNQIEIKGRLNVALNVISRCHSKLRTTVNGDGCLRDYWSSCNWLVS